MSNRYGFSGDYSKSFVSNGKSYPTAPGPQHLADVKYPNTFSQGSAPNPTASDSDQANEPNATGSGRDVLPRDPVPTKLFVGNIGRGATNADLQAVFEQFGEIAECVVFNDYGFVHFYREEEAENALREMHGRDFMGRKLKVEKSTSFVRKKPTDKADSSTCYVCGKYGHWAKDCSQVPEEERAKQRKRADMKAKMRRDDANADDDYYGGYGGFERRRSAYPDDLNYTDFASDDLPSARRRLPPPPSFFDDLDYLYYRRMRDYYDYYMEPRPMPGGFGPIRERADPFHRPPPEYYARRPRPY